MGRTDVLEAEYIPGGREVRSRDKVWAKDAAWGCPGPRMPAAPPGLPGTKQRGLGRGPLSKKSVQSQPKMEQSWETTQHGHHWVDGVTSPTDPSQAWHVTSIR